MYCTSLGTEQTAVDLYWCSTGISVRPLSPFLSLLLCQVLSYHLSDPSFAFAVACLASVFVLPCPFSGKDNIQVNPEKQGKKKRKSSLVKFCWEKQQAIWEIPVLNDLLCLDLETMPAHRHELSSCFTGMTDESAKQRCMLPYGIWSVRFPRPKKQGNLFSSLQNLPAKRYEAAHLSKPSVSKQPAEQFKVAAGGSCEGDTWQTDLQWYSILISSPSHPQASLVYPQKKEYYWSKPPITFGWQWK